jgi:hypothetical protein
MYPENGTIGVYRNTLVKDELMVTYKPGIRTLYDVWQDGR